MVVAGCLELAQVRRPRKELAPEAVAMKESFDPSRIVQRFAFGRA